MLVLKLEEIFGSNVKITMMWTSLDEKILEICYF